MIWELYQQYKITSANSKADALARESGNLGSALTELGHRTDRLALATMAVWSLMCDKFGLTDADLEARMNEIDLSDGKLDGKVRVEARSCPSCNRTLSKRQSKCIYCGAQADAGGFKPL